MNSNIFNQNGDFINTLHPKIDIKAYIYSEEQREAIQKLIKLNYYPHHTSVGRGLSGSKHWSIENYNGKMGTSYKMITTSPFSSNFNHITYFIKF